jgi:hypothetical protein
MDDVDPAAPANNDVPSAPLKAWDDPPPRWAELGCLLAIVVLADFAIYRGDGYAGWAAVFAATPVLLFVGAARRRSGASLALVGAMLALIAVKLLWCGSPVTAVVGTALLPLYAMSLVGRRPYIPDGVSFTASLPYYGGRGFAAYGRGGLQFGRRFAPSTAIAIVLPAVVGVAFSLVFVLANPDLVKSVSETLSRISEEIRDWLTRISPGESLFLCAVAWIAVALLRPSLNPADESAEAADVAERAESRPLETAPRPLYLAWRNTLVVVILIYAIYLAFECRTLWFRVFPKGFYYSGYAHEGAAWLTIGLALATSILSLIFRGRILHDPRVGRLQWLASIWSVENLLLAAAVYHRLFIYINFNGLTDMRIVGLYGVSAVVVGFLLVLLKIVRRHDFVWLLQRHLWTLGVAIYLYAITPVDALAIGYNVNRVLAGDLPPSVQISEHPISAEGLLVLEPLLGCSDEIVRNGVAALLDERHANLEVQAAKGPHWTAYQLAEASFLNHQRTRQAVAVRFTDAKIRRAAWERFRRYAYQWY